MMHTYNVAALEALPIAKDNCLCLTDKHGKDRGANWDIYVLVDNHWIWSGYAWTRKQAWGRTKQMSYDQFTAAMTIGEDESGYDEFYFAYGKPLS